MGEIEEKKILLLKENLSPERLRVRGGWRVEMMQRKRKYGKKLIFVMYL